MKFNQHQERQTTDGVEQILHRSALAPPTSDMPGGLVSRAMDHGIRRAAARRATRTAAFVLAAASLCVLAIVRHPTSTRIQNAVMQPMPAVAMRAIKHGAKHTPLNAIATVPAVASGKHVHAGTQMLRNRKHDNKIAVYSKSPKIATPMWTTTVVTSRHSGIVVNIPQTSGLNAELEPGHAETVSAIPVLTQITLKQIPGDYPLKPQGLNTDN